MELLRDHLDTTSIAMLLVTHDLACSTTCGPAYGHGRWANCRRYFYKYYFERSENQGGTSTICPSQLGVTTMLTLENVSVKRGTITTLHDVSPP